jgi:hypothetical protein
MVNRLGVDIEKPNAADGGVRLEHGGSLFADGGFRGYSSPTGLLRRLDDGGELIVLCAGRSGVGLSIASHGFADQVAQKAAAAAGAETRLNVTIEHWNRLLGGLLFGHITAARLGEASPANVRRRRP